MIGITAHQIMITLSACIDQEKTHYTRASRQKIQTLLTQWHDKSVGLRWISRCIKALVDAGYITRQVRYVHYNGGFILQLPSLFTFTLRGADYLYHNLVRGAKTLRDKIRYFRAKKDNRWPAKVFIDRDEYRKLHAEEMERLKRLRKI